MGGGDLNLKKSWHPMTVRNQEIVWKLEQQQQDEDKKVKQYQKELQREKQIQDLKKLQVDTGLIHPSAATEKMEWMYASSTQKPSSYQDDFLLGKRSVSELLNPTEAAGKDFFSSSNNYRNNAASLEKPQFPIISTPVHLLKHDMESKIREDPLFAIKKKEQEALIKLATSKGLSKPLPRGEISNRSDISDWSSRSSRSISTPLRGSNYREKRKHTWSMSEEERNVRLLEMKQDANKYRDSKVLSSSKYK